MRRTAIPLLALAAAIAAAPPPARAATETYGPWILSCAADAMTDRATCRMTLSTPVEPATASLSALALEVAPRRGRLVPVVTARELGLDSAARGLLALTGTVQLRFPPNKLFEMPCALEGRSVVCAPRPEDASRAAAELAQAPRALVRVLGLGSATAEGPPRELALSETSTALEAFRAQVPPEQGNEPPPPAFDFQELMGRVQRYFFQ
ncbi:hypothetical protein NON00_15410 [Roseomonas sp. GC11]|uniref:hypothetical protein n=1 Tax=Roseomonas sp. GC11 TaxID=2950546 RepID=UPI00210941F3|nr:hypothetical protein [Roseomonas sp. GC11]MCQ4161307.1 hypothetical protein [Roseomonas sp. GC11]